MRFNNISLLIATILGMMLGFASALPAPPAAPSATRYIIGFKDAYTTTQYDGVLGAVENMGGKVAHTFEILPAVVAEIKTKIAADVVLSTLEGVSYVEVDGRTTTKENISNRWMVVFEKGQMTKSNANKLKNAVTKMGGSVLTTFNKIPAVVIEVFTKINVDAVVSNLPGVAYLEHLGTTSVKSAPLAARDDDDDIIRIPELQQFIIGFKSGVKKNSKTVQNVLKKIQEAPIPGTVIQSYFANEPAIIVEMYFELPNEIRKIPGVAYVERADTPINVPTTFKPYIIGFKEDARVAQISAIIKKVHELGGGVNSFLGSMPGIIVNLPTSGDAVKILSALPGVKYVEEDSIMTIKPIKQ